MENRQKDERTDRHIEGQTDRRTNIQKGRQKKGRQTEEKTDRWRNRQTEGQMKGQTIQNKGRLIQKGKQKDRRTDKQKDRRTDKQTDRQTDGFRSGNLIIIQQNVGHRKKLIFSIFVPMLSVIASDNYIM